MSAETLIDRLDALWLEMNDALAEPPAAARILNALHDAAQALRTPPAPTEAVAWRFKFAAAPSWSYRDERPAADWADQCRLLQPLYTHPPQPDALPGDMRERVAQIIEAAIERHNPGNSLRHTLDEADAILSLIQSERGGA